MNSDELIAGHNLDQRRRGLLANSIDRRQIHLRAFARYLEPRSLLDATRQDIEVFLDARPISAQTRYCWISHLHNFYDWADREELGSHDPTARIIRPKRRRALPRPASTDDLRAALKLAGPRDQCWVLLAAYMGLRCQEIAGIRREDVLESEGLLRVARAKGGHERIIPLHHDVLNALRALPMPRAGWVFVRARGGPYPPNHLSQDFNTFLRGAGVDATAHQLRHWFGTNLYAQSHDIRLTQEMLGHTNAATTTLYAAFDRRGASEAIGALNFDGPDPEPRSASPFLSVVRS